MKADILETAIIIRDWSLLLDYWPNLKISETLFPPHLKYIDLLLADDVRMLVYLIDTLKDEKYGISDPIIPHLPFSLLFITAMDAETERLLKRYESRYETPLFFLALDDKKIHDQIVLNRNFAAQLSKVIFIHPDDPLPLTWNLIVNQCLEKVIEGEKKTDEQPS